MSNDSSGTNFAEIARALSMEPSVASTLEYATRTAVAIVDGCDHAGISLVGGRGRITTMAPTDDRVSRADTLQYETGQGPCLQSIVEQETVYAGDLQKDQRWPQWAPRASGELGLRSVLALQLFVGPDAMGALNLYSDAPDAYDRDDRVSALALAAHVAVALDSAKLREDMDSALAHRTVIGHAQGMLMQGLDITADQAFATLVRASQTRNVKLYVIAADVAKHGIRSELLK